MEWIDDVKLQEEFPYYKELVSKQEEEHTKLRNLIQELYTKQQDYRDDISKSINNYNQVTKTLVALKKQHRNDFKLLRMSTPMNNIQDNLQTTITIDEYEELQEIKRKYESLT